MLKRFFLDAVFIDGMSFDLQPNKKSGCYSGFGNFLKINILVKHVNLLIIT